MTRGLSLIRVAAMLAVVVLVALAAAFYLRDLRSPTPATSPTPTPVATTSAPSATPSAAAAATTPAATPVQTGTITGRLGYPSDFVPALTVYAISVNDPSVWFSAGTPRFGNPLSSIPPGPTWPPSGPGTYSISGVAPGTYYVIAYRDDATPQSSFPGAYTQAGAKCHSLGPDGSPPPPGPCPYDQSLIPVTVIAGQTNDRINIVDWLFQGGTYPPRPTPR